MMQALSERFGRWLSGLALFGCLLLLAMMLIIVADVALRNLAGSLSIKTLVTPEWWSLAPLPVVFVLLSIEMVFRMHRLLHAERGPRQDAVSAA
jgi:TRAP-type C4-dicarboxylate transport system permease small subunit